MVGVAVSKEDSLGRGHVRSHEHGVTSIASLRASIVTNVFGNDGHGFDALLGGEAENVNRLLKNRAVLSGEVTDMGAKGLKQVLNGVGDVQNAPLLYEDLYHSIIRDSEAWNLGGV